MATFLRVLVSRTFFVLILLWNCLTTQAQVSTSLCSGSSLDLNTLITAPSGSTVTWSLQPPATAISAGGKHNLALLANGEVVGWGYNVYGQSRVPPLSTSAIAVAAGGLHSVVLLANGTVEAWGWFTSGQTTVPASATPAIDIVAGNTHNLALLTNGSIVGWGSTLFGQTNAPASATPATALAAGTDHSLALLANGSVVGWGRNSEGQTTIPSFSFPATAIDAGGNHSLALLANGSVVGWGWNVNGQISIPPLSTSAIAVAAGSNHSLALLADGSVVGWGSTTYGQTTAPASATPAVAIDAGPQHSLALLANGSVVGWGWNSDGQADGYNSQPLVSPVVSPTATQIYYYIVRNATGIHSTGSLTVTVRLPDLTITQQPTPSLAVCEGSTVSIPVSVSGTGLLGYQWYRNGVILTGNTSATTATLSIPSATTSDTGTYSLVITGACNSVTSTGFQLTVSNFDPTVVITLPNGSTVSVAGSLPTLILPPGNALLQVSGGTLYERLIIVDRVNGFEIRQVDTNTTGIFTINRTGLFMLTVTGVGGCKKVVEGIILTP